MPKTPHREKLLASIDNPKCKADILLLKEALEAYQIWISEIKSLQSKGKKEFLKWLSYSINTRIL
jgi:hypothetical protein